jgi:hypothetical protein
MRIKEEIIFEILGEGGGICISRKKNGKHSLNHAF